MDVYTLFLAIKGLPERFQFENLELILSLVVAVPAVVLCIVMLMRSRKRYRYCPKCRSMTEIGWRTEKRGIANPRVRVNGKGIRFTTGVEKIAVIRCPGCGWEIDLGK